MALSSELNTYKILMVSVFKNYLPILKFWKKFLF